MTRSASTRRRMYIVNSIAPYPQDKPPVWVSLILILVAALGAWAAVAAVVYAVIGL